MDRASLSRAEAGKRLLSRESIKKLCAYYGADWKEGVRLAHQARIEREEDRENG